MGRTRLRSRVCAEVCLGVHADQPNREPACNAQASQVWKPATQQAWKPALRRSSLVVHPDAPCSTRCTLFNNRALQLASESIMKHPPPTDMNSGLRQAQARAREERSRGE